MPPGGDNELRLDRMDVSLHSVEMVRSRFIFVVFNPLLLILCILVLFAMAKGGWIDLSEIARAAQPWQALIASVIALIAAAAAYSAALAKVFLDSQLATLSYLRTHLGLVTRLRYCVAKLIEEAVFLNSVILRGGHQDWSEDDLANFYFSPCREIEEAWAAVDLVPVDLIPHLAELRDLHAAAERVSKRLTLLQCDAAQDDIRKALAKFGTVCSQVYRSGNVLVEGLDVAIRRSRESAKWDT